MQISYVPSLKIATTCFESLSISLPRSDDEIISLFIKEYYQLVPEVEIPSEIIFSYKICDEDKEIFERLLTMLDDVEDVKNVYHNVEI